MTDPAEIRAEGRRLCEDRRYSARFMGDWIRHHADVLLADPAPVGLTEDEREALERIAAFEPKSHYPIGAFVVRDILADIARDALAAPAPAEPREGERVPEGWRVEWETEPPHGPGEGPRQLPYLAEIPVAPSVDPEEG